MNTIAACLVVAEIVCSQAAPRFKEFYSDCHSLAAGRWATYGEENTRVISRVLDTASLYIDYLEKRRDKCGR